MRKKVRLANIWVKRRGIKHFHHIIHMFGVSITEYARDFRIPVDKQTKKYFQYIKSDYTLKEIAEMHNLTISAVSEMYRKPIKRSKSRSGYIRFTDVHIKKPMPDTKLNKFLEGVSNDNS